MVYLFVEGRYVGEAYCPPLWGNGSASGKRRLSDSMIGKRRKPPHPRHSRSGTSIQEEIEATKKQRRRATREREYGRQLDRQREEIHPPHVLETLETLRPPPPASLRLPKAKPDPDREYPVQILPIRPFKTENDT